MHESSLVAPIANVDLIAASKTIATIKPTVREPRHRGRSANVVSFAMQNPYQPASSTLFATDGLPSPPAEWLRWLISVAMIFSTMIAVVIRPADLDFGDADSPSLIPFVVQCSMLPAIIVAAWYGVYRCTSFGLSLDFSRATPVWTSIATLVTFAVTATATLFVVAAPHEPGRWLCSGMQCASMIAWWRCGIAHGKPKTAIAEQ